MSEDYIPDDNIVEVVGALDENVAEEKNALEEEGRLSEISPKAGTKTDLPTETGGASFAAFIDEGLPDGIGIQGLLEPTELGFEVPEPVEYRVHEIGNPVMPSGPEAEEPRILVGVEGDLDCIEVIFQSVFQPLLKCGQWAIAEKILNIIACLTPPVDNELEGGELGDFIAGLSGNDLLVGNGGNDLIFANQGHDTLIGGSGDDSLFGGGNTDVLFGGAGADTLNGGSDNDILVGGLDNDRLFGGAGDDVFKFTSIEDGHDVILDYSLGEIIDLERLFDNLIEDGQITERRFDLNVSPQDEEKDCWTPKDYILTVETGAPNDFSILIQDLNLIEYRQLEENIIVTDVDTIPQ